MSESHKLSPPSPAGVPSPPAEPPPVVATPPKPPSIPPALPTSPADRVAIPPPAPIATAAARKPQTALSYVAAPTLPSAQNRARPRGWLARWRAATPPTQGGEYQAQQAAERRKLPAWMVSFIFHLVLILILAATPLAKMASGPLTIMLGFSSTAGIAEFELSSINSPLDAELIEDEIDASNPTLDAGQLLQVELPTLVDIERTQELGTDPKLAMADIPFGITNGLKGRSGSLKAALLSKFGGNTETEEAVALGLKWLAKQQRSNGSWSLSGPYSDGGVSENSTAATALALNAFLGAGSTHLAGEYRDNVKLGLSFLVRKQNQEGYFPDPREPSRQQMYAQAIATITIAEAFGMSGDSELRIAAQRAMKFAEWSQSKLRGWRYQPREDADLSVTGWFVMALETGKMAGLEVDEAKLRQVEEFLDSVSYEEKSRYAYDAFEPPSLSMTAEGLLCRIYLGWSRTDPALLRAIQDDLLTSPPQLDDESYSVYYWYYATQVLHHVGGPAWEAWNRDMRRVLPAMQEKSGKEMGSWSPSRDAYGAAGGRLYTTCLNLYCLEVYYRHLSIYDIR